MGLCTLYKAIIAGGRKESVLLGLGTGAGCEGFLEVSEFAAAFFRIGNIDVAIDHSIVVCVDGFGSFVLDLFGDTHFGVLGFYFKLTSQDIINFTHSG